MAGLLRGPTQGLASSITAPILPPLTETLPVSLSSLENPQSVLSILDTATPLNAIGNLIEPLTAPQNGSGPNQLLYSVMQMLLTAQFAIEPNMWRSDYGPIAENQSECKKKKQK